MMTRQHLELVASVLAHHGAPPSLVYAMADALAEQSGTAVTPHFDRSRFIAAATTEEDTVTLRLSIDGAAFRDHDGDIDQYALGQHIVQVGRTILTHGLDPNDERPVTDTNGNRCGRIERSTPTDQR